MRNTNTVPGRWAAHCNTSCARTSHRITRVRLTHLGCCITSPISDIHIADKESPAQPNYMGWSAPYGPESSGKSSAYSPILMSTSQVLDAAIQTINALHQTLPFDFGMSLGDACNNTQYNELRWFLDTIDGKAITPSSGAIRPPPASITSGHFRLRGLDPSLLWYQVMGNHDQFWMGCAFENVSRRRARTSATHYRYREHVAMPTGVGNQTGEYMGLIDGRTPYGDLLGGGPEADFTTPPKVGRRHQPALAGNR